MSLAARLENPPPRMPGVPCSIGLLLGALPDPEADALRGMMASREWSDRATAEALKAEGHPVSEQQIGKHRRRQCGCAS